MYSVDRESGGTSILWRIMRSKQSASSPLLSDWSLSLQATTVQPSGTQRDRGKKRTRQSVPTTTTTTTTTTAATRSRHAHALQPRRGCGRNVAMTATSQIGLASTRWTIRIIPFFLAAAAAVATYVVVARLCSKHKARNKMSTGSFLILD